ncbi:MAG: hypothetical protein PHI24_09845 [Desulfitobacteriaceae bacterium]|nr:hypothetical protein [Desulfitobacteriaceae bacterium]
MYHHIVVPKLFFFDNIGIRVVHLMILQPLQKSNIVERAAVSAGTFGLIVAVFDQ